MLTAFYKLTHKTMGLFLLSFLPVFISRHIHVKITESSPLQNGVWLVKVLRSRFYDGYVHYLLSFSLSDDLPSSSRATKSDLSCDIQ